MWNEYMEWEDDNDQITFYDEKEFAEIENRGDPQHQDQDNLDALKPAITVAALGIGFIGYHLGTAIANQIKKRKEKTNADATTEWVRANLKNKEQKAPKSIPSYGDSRKDRDRTINS